MFSHIFSQQKPQARAREQASRSGPVSGFEAKPPVSQPENEAPANADKSQINTADINYKEYDQVHLLCMRVIVYFVSKYVIVYDIKTWADQTPAEHLRQPSQQNRGHLHVTRQGLLCLG